MVEYTRALFADQASRPRSRFPRNYRRSTGPGIVHAIVDKRLVRLKIRRCWISIGYKLIITRRSKKRTNEPKENTMRRKWCTRRLKFCEAYIYESNFKDRINFLVRIDRNVLQNLQYLEKDVIGSWFIVSIAELILHDNYMSRNRDRIYFLTHCIFV